MEKEQSKTRAMASRVIFAALSTLKENGGEMHKDDIVDSVSKKVSFDQWEAAVYPKTGDTRWVTALRLFAIDCIKAGFLLKEKGIWTLTKEGESALSLGSKGLLDEVSKRYKEWESINKKQALDGKVSETVPASLKDIRSSISQKQLSLIGTWKEIVDEHESVENAIEQRGGWASWWSFPIEDEAKRLLTTPFYLYLNSGGGVFPYRMKVEEYQASRGNDGISSPWPNLTDENCRDTKRAGDKQSEIFKTWLRISEIEEMDPPLTLDDMTLAESLSHATNVLNQNRFGYVYLKDASATKVGGAKSAARAEFPEQPEYSLETCVWETGLDLATLERWVRAIERKGQAVLYGPPGTGKTYVAERMAKHLVGGGNGFVELVQFHPTYSYKDFIQGIRPKARKDGGLDYPLVPGRFLEFCEKAKCRTGLCVLILDEINRANLSRVFGEMMYLLEYRDKEIPLSGGESFGIPSNVRLLGTMNTADRSIALVDHALRRRFAFLELYPNYDILEKYHVDNGFSATGLIETLKRVNKQIGDHHYMVGISFFLRPDIKDHIEDIWRMEIEPYLEEYFFGHSRLSPAVAYVLKAS